MVLDQVALDEITEGDAGFKAVLLAEYQKTTPPLLEELGNAVKACDFEQVTYRAHMLKGSSRSICAPALSEAAYDMEMAGRSGAPDGLAPAYEDLVGHSRRLFAEIERILDPA
ncbi:MAG TPA: Hpt domain-containing protein [Fimbriimonas sp.]